MSYADVILADAPKAYWKCQDAGNPPASLVDSSGNNLPMTTVTLATGGQAGITPAPDNQSLLTGNSTAISRTVISTVTTNFTLELWVNPAAFNASGTMLSNGSGSTGYFASCSSAGKLRAGCNGVGNLSDSVATLSTGTWYHVVIVRGASVWTYYINGTVDTANAGTTSPNTPATTTNWGNGFPQSTNGVAHMALYETALSSGQVTAHYTAASVVQRLAATTPRIVYQRRNV